MTNLSYPSRFSQFPQLAVYLEDRMAALNHVE